MRKEGIDIQILVQSWPLFRYYCHCLCLFICSILGLIEGIAYTWVHPLVFSGVRVTRVLCVCFVDRCLSFYTFSVGYVLSVLLRFTDSDYSFGIIKLFFSPEVISFVNVLYSTCFW